jgi:predicted transcriptional regulator
LDGFGAFIIDKDILDHWQRLKLDRMNMLRELLSKRGVVDKKSFVAELCVECGFHKQTVHRYLNELRDYGLIEITNDKIFWKGKGGD